MSGCNSARLNEHENRADLIHEPHVREERGHYGAPSRHMLPELAAGYERFRRYER